MEIYVGGATNRELQMEVGSRVAGAFVLDPARAVAFVAGYAKQAVSRFEMTVEETALEGGLKKLKGVGVGLLESQIALAVPLPEVPSASSISSSSSSSSSSSGVLAVAPSAQKRGRQPREPKPQKEPSSKKGKKK